MHVGVPAEFGDVILCYRQSTCIPVLLDAAPVSNLTADVKDLLTYVDIFTSNSAEVTALFDQKVATLNDAIEFLLSDNELADIDSIITFDDDGSVVRAAGQPAKHIPVTSGNCCRRQSGAGDAFRAGLLTALLEGHDLEDAAKLRHTVAGFAVTGLELQVLCQRDNNLRCFRRNPNAGKRLWSDYADPLRICAFAHPQPDNFFGKSFGPATTNPLLQNEPKLLGLQKANGVVFVSSKAIHIRPTIIAPYPLDLHSVKQEDYKPLIFSRGFRASDACIPRILRIQKRHGHRLLVQIAPPKSRVGQFVC